VRIFAIWTKRLSLSVKAFLNAPLWDGNKFYDVEYEIVRADP
jgi:hypothetical protein